MLSLRASRCLHSIRAFPKKPTTTSTLRTSRALSSNKSSSSSTSHQEAIQKVNESMAGYVETRLLAKQGKLVNKRRPLSKTKRSEHVMQMSLFLSLAVAFVASPFLGKKIAQDKEFREKYIPAWYDFTVKSPTSAWTREEMHHQLIEVEKELRERAIQGDFTPENLAALKRNLKPRSDLTEEDHALAAKYGWSAVHPGFGVDGEDEDDGE